MKIGKIHYKIKKVYLKEPVTVSFGTISFMNNIFLSTTLNNKQSLAEISNLEFVTKVTEERVLKDLAFAINYIEGKDINNFEKHIEYLNARICMPALCGIDNLLYSLYCNYKDINIYEYINKEYKKVKPLNYTIGIQESKEKTLKVINEYLADGKVNIKLKTGANVNDDIETINYIFQNNKNIKLRLDINQGYNLEQYELFIKNVDLSRIILIEQVSKYDDIEILEDIRNVNDKVYLLADESVRTYDDAKKLAENKQVDAFNIKLIKCGGIYNAIKINEIAQKYNIETMIGCMVETQLALSYAANLYLGINNMKNADLDSFWLLKDANYESNILFTDENISIK